jgi:hypothetical protein
MIVLASASLESAAKQSCLFYNLKHVQLEDEQKISPIL